MIALVLLIMLPFLWCGMVFAISFIETPLKFRAPGMTRALGVGMGRLVFKVLNLFEAAMAVAIVAAWTQRGGLVSATAGTFLFIAIAALALQVTFLRPAMAKRTRATSVAAGHHDGGAQFHAKVATATHLGYIVSEFLKVLALPVAGVLIILAVEA
jgi:hypothetical protein